MLVATLALTAIAFVLFILAVVTASPLAVVAMFIAIGVAVLMWLVDIVFYLRRWRGERR